MQAIFEVVSHPGVAGAAQTTRPTSRVSGIWLTSHSQASVLAFVTDAGPRAEEIAQGIIEMQPHNWKLVLAFSEETRFGNEWVASRFPNVRIISWRQDRMLFYIYFKNIV